MSAGDYFDLDTEAGQMNAVGMGSAVISSLGQIVVGIFDKRRADQIAENIEREHEIKAWFLEVEALRNRDTRTTLIATQGGDVGRTGVFQIAQAAMIEAFRADWTRYMGEVMAANARNQGRQALASGISGGLNTLAGATMSLERPGSGDPQLSANQPPPTASERDFQAYVYALESDALGPGSRPLGPISQWPEGPSEWVDY